VSTKKESRKLTFSCNLRLYNLAERNENMFFLKCLGDLSPLENDFIYKMNI